VRTGAAGGGELTTRAAGAEDRGAVIVCEQLVAVVVGAVVTAIASEV
jgi:hypothetical protein